MKRLSVAILTASVCMGPGLFDCCVECISGQSNVGPGTRSLLMADEKADQKTDTKADSKSDSKDEPEDKEAVADARMELEITINRPEGNSRGYRRPYVAAWLTDKEGVPVRTLVLWVQKSQPGPRWIPDLRQWNREDRLRKLVDDRDLVDAVASPTKNAGEYKVTWDGKDDQGQTVPAGTYTLNIEAAREHGTYQIIKQKLELGKDGFEKSLDGNVEIKAVKVNYRGLKAD